MKKILLATTVLVAGASYAMADVSVSGDGRMGILNTNGTATFSERARVSFKLSGESDAGLSFGGSFRADQATDSTSGIAGSVFVSGPFGKISMGSVVGAAEAAVGNLSNVGYTDVVKGGTNTDPDDIAFLTGDAKRTSALYAYTLGDASIFVSGTDKDTVASTNKGAAVGLSYVIGDYTVAVGYENAFGTTNPTNVGVSASFAGVFGPVKAKALYLTTDTYKSFGASATYTADVLAVTATWINADSSSAEKAAYGLGATYDLGGGLTANAGYAVNGKGTYKYDLGVKFKF